MEGFIRNIKPIEILTDNEMDKTVQRSIEVIQNTGVVFEDERVLKLLEQKGCEIEYSTRIARIPEQLVFECLKKCPEIVEQKARDKANTLLIGGNRTYVSMACGMDTLDLDTWERRIPTIQDQDKAVTVVDALDNIHTFEYGPYHNLKGIHPLMIQPMITASFIRNSTKAGFSGSLRGCEIWNIRMAKATDQQLLGLVASSSPLTFSKDATNAAFAFAEAGFPIDVDSGVTYGATGPITLAGSMILTNAELLAGLVTMQTIKPGIGVVVSTFPNPMDMRHGIPVFGAVERAIHGAAFCQFWRHLGIPTRLTASYTSAKTIDYQAGYEKSLQFMLSALGACNIVTLAGSVFGELTHHPVMSVIDDDISGMIGRVLRGVDMSDQHLATNLIDEVGQVPGNYLGKKHTRVMYENEYFVPKVGDRLPYSTWLKLGNRTVFKNATERYHQIISTHRPTSLPDDQNKKIEEILAAAQGSYKKQGIS